VLNEFYVVVTRKLQPGLDPDTARKNVRELLAWQPQAVDGDVIAGAWAVQDAFAISFWDALVVSAAHACGCRYLLTEDLQHGQDLGGLTVLSPFLAEPADAS
jgi:predicted nucleic acid-binding protein